MKPYASLTERGQARRLRPLAWQALQQYDLKVTRLRLVTNDLNGIFRVDTSTGEKYILRIALPEAGHTWEHVAVEMDWLSALAGDTTLRIPRPIPARNGKLFVEAQAAGVPEVRLCAIFTYMPGNDLAHHLTVDNMMKLGAISATLHQHARTYQPPSGLSILRYDQIFPFPEPVILFQERYSHLFPPSRRQVYEWAIERWQQAIDRLQTSGEAMRIIHNDLHQWNVRYYRGKLSPIDFEDLMWGWPVQDIAITLYYLLGQASYAELRQAFQTGYTQVSPWPERYPGEIEAFIVGRAVDLANFILNDPNPKWKIQAGEFIERVEKRLTSLIARKND